MTIKIMTTIDGKTVYVNLDQVIFSKEQSDGNFFCRFSTGDNMTFTTDPLAS